MKLWMVFGMLALSVVLIRGTIWAFPEAFHTRAHVEWLADQISAGNA